MIREVHTIFQPNSMYLLCFFLSQKGLKDVFDEAIIAALEPPEPPKSKGCILL